MASPRPFIALCALISVLTAGCQTPGCRAREHAAVFGHLTPADQRLVLHGHVRTGLSRDAVLIAWGEPERKIESGASGDGKGRPSSETWIYRRRLTIHGPIGSADQWHPGNSLVPPGLPLMLSPGYGFGTVGNEGLLLYRPNVQPSDSFVRRVAFVDGKLVDFDSWYGDQPPLP